MDWGLYQGLKYENDYPQMYHNADQNLAYISDLNKQAKQQQDAEELAQKGALEHLQHAKDAISVALPADKQRMKDYYQTIIAPLQESLKSNPQSISQWAQSGGHVALDKFEDDLKNGQDSRGSNPFTDSVANMALARQKIADEKSGLSPLPLNGQPYDFNADLADVATGKRNTLQYPGAYKRQKYDVNDFINHYGDEDHSKRVPVSPQQMQADMARNGIHPAQIMEDLPKFFDPKLKTKDNPYGSVYWFKNDNVDPLDRQKKQAEIYKIYHEGEIKDNKNSPENTAANGYLNLLGGLYNGTAQSYENRYDENNNNKYQVSNALNGTVIGTFEDGNKDKIPDIVTGVKRHADGSLWYASTKTEALKPDDPWVRVNDLHTQLGKKYLKTDDAASGGLKVESAAYQLSKARGDNWKTGSPNYSLYGNDENVAQPNSNTGGFKFPVKVQ